jgi:nicotinate-nucleotide--dimethylbenzimidazole phosphoribosyltransferase
LVIFAADHGVVAEGVTAWPSSVTGVMIRSIVQGGAASSSLAASCDVELALVDVGSQSQPLPARYNYSVRKVGPGTANLAEEPAMTLGQFEESLAIGRSEAQRAFDDGMSVVAAGEMGIGNTTSASCLAVLLAEVPLDQAIGRGAGADEAILARKRLVVEAATRRAARSLHADSRSAIAAIAGFEIVAMAGFFVEAHRLRLTIVLDGMIATAGALIAEVLEPGTSGSMIAAHRSDEPAHSMMLGRLGLEPLLTDWALRLGEGTGALLAMPLLDAASAILRMETLEGLGILPSEAADGPP